MPAESRFSVDPRAAAYYDIPIKHALELAREQIELWDYEEDPHGYCHDRSVLVALVEAIERPLSAPVVAAARRVQRAHRMRMLDEVSAFHAWQHDSTLSNAIRRDDTRKDLLELSDANTLATAILSQFEAESKAWHDANPVNTYA